MQKIVKVNSASCDFGMQMGIAVTFEDGTRTGIRMQAVGVRTPEERFTWNKKVVDIIEQINKQITGEEDARDKTKANG